MVRPGARPPPASADAPADQSEEQIEERKEELFEVIAEILRRHPRLCYFQGYHDIVQVFLLVLGPSLAVPAVTRLSLLRIRDFMLPSLDAAIAHLNLLPSILYSVDPALCKHLRPAQPFFALAATITMYAHDIQVYGDIARLFDFLLAREAVISLYLFAAVSVPCLKRLCATLLTPLLPTDHSRPQRRAA